MLLKKKMVRVGEQMSFSETNIKGQNLRGKLSKMRYVLPKVLKTRINQIQLVLFKKMCSF